jgi:hypothetical protein
VSCTKCRAFTECLVNGLCDECDPNARIFVADFIEQANITQIFEATHTGGSPSHCCVWCGHGEHHHPVTSNPYDERAGGWYCNRYAPEFRAVVRRDELSPSVFWRLAHAILGGKA